MTDRARLDGLLPQADVRLRHQLAVAAPPDRVWQALKATTLREMPLVWLLFALRSLPARLTRNRGLPSALDAPLFTQMAARGFALLAEDPGPGSWWLAASGRCGSCAAAGPPRWATAATSWPLTGLAVR